MRPFSGWRSFSVQGLPTSLSSYDGRLAEKTAALVETLTSDPDVAAAISSFLFSLLVSVLAVTVQVAGNFLFAAVLTAFLLLEFDRFMGLATAVSQDRIVFKTLPSLVVTAIRYIGIRTRLNLITGAGVILLCLLFGVDYPLLWAHGPSSSPWPSPSRRRYADSSIRTFSVWILVKEYTDTNRERPFSEYRPIVKQQTAVLL
ncbi:MAG: hypothetical protein R6X34_30410 [Chloroflexota bacterium]